MSLLLVALFTNVTYAQFQIPERPKDTEQVFVYDYIQLLAKSHEIALKRKLKNYADTTSTQIVIAVISSTKGEDISYLGARWGQKWGIGQADEDNGILILLAKDDRMVDINTGYGIEYRVTDLMCERIINRIMIPEFKEGDYYGGLQAGTDALIQALNGEFDAEPKNDFNAKPLIMFIVFILIWIILISASRKGRGGNGSSGTGSLLDVIILSNAGRTGGFGGGSGSFGSGGSFGGGGFGGGGFGGGGASGGW